MPGTDHIPSSTLSTIRHQQQLDFPGSSRLWGPAAGTAGVTLRLGSVSCRARADGAAEGCALGDRWLWLPWCPPSSGTAHSILPPLLLLSSILSVQQAPHDSSGTDPVADGGSALHTLSLAPPPGSPEGTVPSLVVLSPSQSPLPSWAASAGALNLCSPPGGELSLQPDAEAGADHGAGIGCAGRAVSHGRDTESCADCHLPAPAACATPACAWTELSQSAGTALEQGPGAGGTRAMRALWGPPGTPSLRSGWVEALCSCSSPGAVTATH